jgi:type II secretory pathway pseudopilin PulG
MLQRKKLPRDCGAFTLIEVALAATVLLFAIVSAFQIVAAGTRMLDFSRKQTIATQIIHAEIDQARLCSWTALNAMVNTTDTVTLSTTTTSNTWASGSLGYPELNTFKAALGADMATTGFTVARAVTYVPGRSNEMVKIVFTVTWKAKVFSEKNGSSHTYSRQGTTYVGKNGLSATYQRS